MAGEVLFTENVNGNLIRLDDQGGVVTKFGNVQETYQLDEADSQKPCSNFWKIRMSEAC